MATALGQSKPCPYDVVNVAEPLAERAPWRTGSCARMSIAVDGYAGRHKTLPYDLQPRRSLRASKSDRRLARENPQAERACRREAR